VIQKLSVSNGRVSAKSGLAMIIPVYFEKRQGHPRGVPLLLRKALTINMGLLPPERSLVIDFLIDIRCKSSTGW
jgi:hypothetical protein